MSQSYQKVLVSLVVFWFAGISFSNALGQMPESLLSDGTPYIANRVVVLTKPNENLLTTQYSLEGFPATGISSIDQLCRQLGVEKVEAFYPGILRSPKLANLASRLRILTLQPGLDAREAALILANDSHLISAEIQTLPKLFYTPNDPNYSDQWHLPHIQAPAAWDFIRSPQTHQSVVAIIDTGLHLEHEEIQNNLWINELEDINHNGQFDPNDINGIDEDGNGMVDDVVGWDFADNDNNPQAIHPHGTGTATCISAVTDNGTMGAAVGFGVRLMPVKAISDHGQLVDGYISMFYAADNGAQIINCSWGVPMYQGFEQAIVDAVWAEDVVIVGAGGEGSQLSYPAAYNHVVAVSATDQNDHLASFGSYGEYIDICAPGVNILMVWDDELSILSGSSFSTGIVAGTLGLFRAQHPDMNNAAIIQLMEQSADSIDDQNPGYVGLLGAGRINAFAGVVSALAIDDEDGLDVQNLVCRPNPFNARISVAFRLEKQSQVTLTVFDVRGRQVETLLNERQLDGFQEVFWDASNAASGTYFLVMTTGDSQLIRKLSLVK